MPTIDGKEVLLTVADSCTACGLCTKACACEYLSIENGKAGERKDAPLGCISCGQCAAVCPVGAIRIEASGLVKEDIFDFPSSRPATCDELYSLLSRRRSIRKFRVQEVPAADVDRILEASQQAPSGLPPSSVRTVVLAGKDTVRQFAFGFLGQTARAGWLFTSWGIWTLRPSMSAKDHREMRTKIAPLYRGLIDGWRNGQDYLFYDAPLAMVFTSEGDPVDATIAATYAMVTAETLGLGSCLIGTVVPMLGMTSPEFRERYGFPAECKHGVAIIFGYPELKFQRAVRRRFAAIANFGRGVRGDK